jgi:hypothetical protein
MFFSFWSNNSASRSLSEAYQLLDLKTIEKAIFQWAWRQSRSLSKFTLPTLEELTDRSERGRNILDGAVDDQIMRGRLIARGFEKAEALKGKPIPLAPERWKLLTKDYSKSTAALENEPVLFGITVMIARSAAKQSKKKVAQGRGFTPPRDTTLQIEVREWLEGQMRVSPNVKIKTKEQLRAELEKDIPGVSARLFQDAYKAAVKNAQAAAWSKAGPVSRITPGRI